MKLFEKKLFEMTHQDYTIKVFATRQGGYYALIVSPQNTPALRTDTYFGDYDIVIEQSINWIDKEILK